MFLRSAMGGQIDVGVGISANQNASVLFAPSDGTLGQYRDDAASAPMVLRSSAPIGRSSVPLATEMLGQFIKVEDSNCYVREGWNDSLVWKLPVRYGVRTEIIIPAADCKFDYADWDNPFSNIRTAKNVAIRVTNDTKRGFIAWGLLSESQAQDIVNNDITEGTLDRDGKALPPDPSTFDKLTDKYTGVVKDTKNAALGVAGAVALVAVVVAAIWFLPRTGG